MINSVAIVRLSALGDVLMAVPAVRALQDAYPHAEITWIISPPAYDLVSTMENIRFIVIEKPNSIADYWRFYKQMRSQKFDVLLAMQASFRANLLYPLISANRKIGYDKLRAKDGHGLFINESIAAGKDHTLEGFLKFAQMIGAQTDKLYWNLPMDAADTAWAKKHVKRLSDTAPLVIINPAASKPERSWLPNRYVAVIKHLQKNWGAQVVLVGGPGQHDRDICNTILKQVDVIDLVGKTKLKQLMAVLALADVVLCPDTGPSHMATAVGTPVIALHAVTSSKVSGPYLSRHLVVDAYSTAAEKILGKDPEEVVWGRHIHGNDTMDLVSTDAVIQRFDEFLST